MKKILALVLALALVFSLAACKGNKDTDNTTDTSDTQVNADNTAAGDESTEAQSEDATDTSDESAQAETEIVTDAQGHTQAVVTPSKNNTSNSGSGSGSVSSDKGLNTSDAAKIVAAYKAAAAKTKQFASGQQKLNLDSAITADGGLGAVLKIVQKPIANALSKNSNPRTDVPGNPAGLQASHLSSGSAVTNGNITTLTMNIKDQTQGAKADNHSGSVGCAVGTLGNVDNAIKELGFNVDYTNGDIKLTYTNCKVVVKIDNTTGKIIDGSWVYKVNVHADGIKVVGYTVKNLKGVVGFSYTAKG